MGSSHNFTQLLHQTGSNQEQDRGAEGHLATAVSRAPGTRAELASLKTQLRVAKARGDVELERAAGAKLARRLVGLGVQLDTATRLARRSLLLGEDPRLREELSSWFSSLGRLGLAAGTLEPLLDRQLPPADKARLWTRIAVLRARAGEIEQAATALLNAAHADPRDALALELYGAGRAWSPSVIEAPQAAAALLMAAERRELAGQERAATEDVLQAVLVSPNHFAAVERMAAQLLASGRPQAADEVWRRSVEPLSARDERRQEVHRARWLAALDAQLPAVAFGAALDLEADRELDYETISNALELVNEGAGSVPIPTFDGMLHALGLTEWLLQRAKRVAQRSVPYARAKLSLQVAKVLAGPLSQPERAGALLLECLWTDPARDEVYAALEEYASSTGDLGPLVEGLVGLGRTRMDHPATRRRLEQLAVLSDSRLRDPSPGVWALDKLAEQNPLTPELAALRRRLSGRVAEVRVPQTHEWSLLTLSDLRQLVDVLSQRPDEAQAYAAGLREMVERDPGGVRWLRLLERVLVALGRESEVQVLWGQQLESNALDPSTCRLGLLRAYRRAGQVERVLELMTSAGDSVSAEEAAHFIVATSEVGSDWERAMALALVGRSAKPGVRAVLLATASELLRKHGDVSGARELSESACRSDAHMARAFVSCAEAMGSERSRVAGLIFERACRMTLPRVEWCRALAEVAQQTGNLEQQLKWLRRWASLTPLDTDAASQLIDALSLSDDAAALEAATDWLLGLPQLSQNSLQPVMLAIRRLAQLAPDRARTLLRRAIGVYGVLNEDMVVFTERIAQSLDDTALIVAVRERQVAQAEEPTVRVRLLLETAKLRCRIDESDQALDNLHQAFVAGASPDDVEQVLLEIEDYSSSDAQLHYLELSYALSARALEDADVERRAVARSHHEQLRRQLALAYRDLALDKERAYQVLEEGLDGASADATMAFFRDLVAVLGHVDAVVRVETLAQQSELDVHVRLKRAAGRVLVTEQHPELAFRLARPALDLSPLDTELLDVLEKAIPADAPDALQSVYERIDAALLGPYGERALHYRAAREFERRGEPKRALAHAVRAFEAVPTTGIAYALMLRLAQTQEEKAEVRAALGRVASLAPTPELRASWLDRAVQTEALDARALAQRLDVLLRALAVCADAHAVTAAGEVVEQVLRQSPQQLNVLKSEFDRAIQSALRQVDGETGAGVAVAAARAARDVFRDPALAALYLGWAVEFAPQSPAFASLTTLDDIAVAPEAAVGFLTVVLQQLDKGASISPALLRMSRDAAEKWMPEASAPLAVAVARVAPNDAEAVTIARRAAASEPQLLDKLQQVAQPQYHATALLQEVRELPPLQQAQRLDVALRELRPDSSWFGAVVQRLASLSHDPAAAPHVEGSLRYLSAQEAVGTAERAAAVRALVDLLSTRNAHSAALDMLALLEQWRESTAVDQRRGAEIAHAALDEERELGYLAQLELQGALGSEQERAAVLCRIAELHAAAGSRRQATHYYERVLALQPGHQVARDFLLQDAERSEDFASLAARLEEQLTATDGDPSLALTLHQLYTERLGQPDQGRVALERALELHGENEELLNALATHLRDHGQHRAAGKAYQRASRESRHLPRASHYAEQACRSYMQAGDDDSVRAILAVKGLFPNTQQLAEMRVEIARRQEQYEELANALEELSVVSKASAWVRAGYLLEAAQLCLAQLDDFERALRLSERGSRMAPSHVVIQLFTRMLQYRKRGVGTRQDALYTITDLRSLRPTDGPTEVELRGTALSDAASRGEVRAFLLAEALRVRSGPTAGLRELVEAREQFGPRPLLELGLAERLSHSDTAEQQILALEHYAGALAGDLRELRSSDAVALAAARLALEWGEPNRAQEFARRVRPESEHGSEAQALMSQIGSASGPPRKPTGDQKATTLGMGEPAPPAVVAARPRLLTAPGLGEAEVAAVFAEAERALSEERLHRDIDQTEGSDAGPEVKLGSPSSVAPHPHGQEPQLHSIQPASPRGQRPIPPPKPATRSGTHASMATPLSEASDDQRPRPRPAVVVTTNVAVGAATLANEPEASEPATGSTLDALNESPVSARRSLGPTSASERKLMQALSEGLVEAGDELLRIMSNDPGRTHELVAVCRLIAHWLPGDIERLRALHEAVITDNDPVYARALLHAKRSLSDPASAPVAPPLHRQTEHVDAVVKLLAGPSLPGHEALGLLWQHAPELFRHHAPGPIAERRVEQASSSALSQLLTEVSRLFGCARVAVYAAESEAPPEFELVLAHPAALILRGQLAADAPSFRYHFGRMMFATRPEYALVFGLEESELKTVLHAVGVGFGPPRRLASDLTHVANLAERLWEMLPPPVQRRLGELCEQQHVLEPAVVIEGARRALRRAGLFVCGDLRAALEEVALAEELKVTSSLRDLCEQSEAAADLVRFATSLEYADARWRSGVSRSSLDRLVPSSVQR